MKIDIYSIMIMAISIMFVLITFYLWLKYGKEDNDMEVIEEFYPPKECNSLETGYIYKRYIDKKDVVSLLIYLANKGYLKIEQTTDQGIFKKSKGFRIIKIKEYEGNNEIEKIFLEELFFHSDNSVTGLQLKDNFEKATEKVKKIISDNKENKEKFFLPRPKKVIKNLTAMSLLMYALITIKPIIEFYGIIFGWILALFQMIITIIGFVFLFISIWGNGPKTTKIVLAIFGNICIIPTLINIIWPALLANKNNFKLVVIDGNLLKEGEIGGLPTIESYKSIILIIFMVKMHKRTQYGNELFVKIKGFRRFFKITEKSQLKRLIMQDSKYFYDILSYIYVLDEYEIWMKYFKEMDLKIPSWYNSKEDLCMQDFLNFLLKQL